MENLIEIFKEFDINNIWLLISVSIILIGIIANYIQLLYTSKMEAIFMSRNDEAKRFSFIYVILFFVLVALNYMFTINTSFVICNIIFFMLTLLISFILSILKKVKTFKKMYWWCEERKSLIILLTTTSILVFFASILLNVNLISCIILGSFIEVVVIAITLLNNGNKRSFVIWNIKNEKWYVFKRIDEKYLL